MTTGRCASCGRPIPRRKRGPERLYCDATCRWRAWRARRPLGAATIAAWGIEPVNVLELLGAPEYVSQSDLSEDGRFT
jgi:hypothetical protein